MVYFLLRLALALPFLYAGVDGLMNEDNWIGFVPRWAASLLENIAPNGVDGVLWFLYGFSVLEIALAAALLLGWQVQKVAMVSAAILAGITLSNLAQLLVVFRDVGVFFAALALAMT